MCTDSVHIWNTRSRGASKTRVRTISRSEVPSTPTLALAAAMLFLLCLQIAQIDVQAIETLSPEAAVVVYPVGDVFEGARAQSAGAPLGFAAAGDQARVLEYFEMLGHSGQAH